MVESHVLKLNNLDPNQTKFGKQISDLAIYKQYFTETELCDVNFIISEFRISM